jgi:hypothetical protein
VQVIRDVAFRQHGIPRFPGNPGPSAVNARVRNG